MPADRDDDELGALWERKSSKGELMMTGTIDGVDVVCFLVKRTTEKSPTWRVLKSRPRAVTEPPAQRVSTPRLPMGRGPLPVDDDDPDIPF